MNPQARSEFDPTITRDDWDRLGYLSNDGPLEITLTNPIHPIFFWKNADRPDGEEDLYRFAGKQSKERFEHLLEPVHKLASQILFSPGSVRFIYWLLYSPRVELQDLSLEHGTPIQTFGPIGGVPYGHMYQGVDKALIKLAEHISYSWRSAAKDHKMANTRGLADYDLESGVSSADILGRDDRIGVGANVCINEQFVTLLEDLYENSADNGIQILNVNFNYAKTLCHELMHALYLATEPSIKRLADYDLEKFLAAMNGLPKPTPVVENTIDMMFQDESVGEVGFSYDNFVFGGRVEWDPFKCNTASRVHKWPSFLTGGVYLRSPRAKETATEYFMPKQYLQRIHQQDFWATKVRPEHVTALRIEKSIGIRYNYPGNDPDPDWTASNSSEGVWPLDRNRPGRVERIQRDPSASKINEPFNVGSKFNYARLNGTSGQT